MQNPSRPQPTLPQRPSGGFPEPPGGNRLKGFKSGQFYANPQTDFDLAIWPRGCVKVKSCVEPKVFVFLVTFKFCFMPDPPIPNFYLANMETSPFSWDFDKPVGPQGCVQLGGAA